MSLHMYRQVFGLLPGYMYTPLREGQYKMQNSFFAMFVVYVGIINFVISRTIKSVFIL